MRIINFGLVMVASLLFAEPRAGEAAWLTKYPHAMLTPTYGTLKEGNLGVDAWFNPSGPPDKTGYRSGYHRWVCAPTKDVRPHYHAWRDNHPMGSSNVIVSLCDLIVDVRVGNELHQYVGRRAHELKYCQNFMKEWKKLTKGERHVCFNGEGGGFAPEFDPSGGKLKARIWTWEKFKTRKGCYSNFDGYCDLTYWKKLGYPAKRTKPL